MIVKKELKLLKIIFKKFIKTAFVLMFTATIFNCTSQKEVNVEKKQQQPEQKEVSDSTKNVPVSDQIETDITSDDFDKGKSIHHIRMLSIKTGNVIKFEEYKGKKILFDFWSSWCEPCIAMFPVINKLKKVLEDEKGTLKILSISVDPMQGKIKEIINNKKVLFEVLQAPESLANSGILMPFVVIADENGKIIKTLSGKHTYQEFLEHIEKN